MSEQQDGMEKMVALAKGDKGERGAPGPGMLPVVRYAIIFLFLLSLVLGAADALFAAHEVNANNAAMAREHAQQQAAARREQAAQRREGQLIEQKLCADLSTMAAIKPPAGNPAQNPSRAYEQAEARAWHGLVTGLGCH